MKRKRHTPEEIIKKLREAGGMLAGGKNVEKVSRACRSLGQPRSTHRYRGRRRRVDGDLIKAMRRIARREPRAGYRSVARHLKREG